MSRFQNIIPFSLGQVALSTSYTLLYTVPAATRTYVKQFDICNTTGAPMDFYISIVPAGGTASDANAIFYNAPIPGNTVVQWNGVQIMYEGGTIQVKASAVGCTVTASGGEAI